MSELRESNGNLWRFLKPLCDAVLVFLSFLTAHWIRYELQWIRQVEPAYLVPFTVYVPSVFALVVILLFVYWVEGAYRLRRGTGFLDEFYIVLRGTLIGISAMIVVVFLASPSYYSRLIFGYTGLVTLLFLGVFRAVEQSLLARRRRRGIGVVRVLIVGAGEVGRSLMRTLVARPELGFQIAGFVDDDPARSHTDIGPYPALGTTDEIPQVVSAHNVDEVIITLPWMSHRKILRIMRQCERGNIRVRIVPDLFQMTLSMVVVENLGGIPLLGISAPALRDWQMVTKRVTDVIISALGLLLLWPIMGVIGLAIRLESPGAAIFRQTRVGRANTRFTCYKFRSMYVGAESGIEALRDKNEAKGHFFKIHDDPRATRVGRLLRRASLDELPQLWNVLKGEMSLIGPRPPTIEEVEDYEPWHLRRLEVRPGITGLWQVSGRSDLSFDEMVLLDVYYIENWSPLLDLRIVVKTIPTVIMGRGAY